MSYKHPPLIQRIFNILRCISEDKAVTGEPPAQVQVLVWELQSRGLVDVVAKPVTLVDGAVMTGARITDEGRRVLAEYDSK